MPLSGMPSRDILTAMSSRLLFSLVAALALVGCHAKITGALHVDGAAFKVAECRSGRAFGFSGIQLADAQGRRLRLMQLVDGSTVVALFPPNAARGDRLGTCGTLSMQAQNSRINNIQNMKGTATLSCNAIGHQVSGHIEFENCH